MVASHKLPPNQLSDAVIKERLQGYSDPRTTEQLYTFGVILLNESLDSIHRIDAKAYSLAGWAGATFSAFVSVATFARNEAGDYFPVLLFVAALFALAAVAFSLASIRVRSMEWFSPNEWIPRECLDNAETLKRYHIYCMYGVRQSHRSAYAIKVSHVHRAHACVFMAGVMLIVAVISTPAFAERVRGMLVAINSFRVSLW